MIATLGVGRLGLVAQPDVQGEGGAEPDIVLNVSGEIEIL